MYLSHLVTYLMHVMYLQYTSTLKKTIHHWLLVSYWTWTAISWMKILCILFPTVHPRPPPYTDFSLFTLLPLIFFIAAVIITTAVRDRHQTTNTGLTSHSHFRPVWSSFWWGRARWLRKTVISHLCHSLKNSVLHNTISDDLTTLWHIM